MSRGARWPSLYGQVQLDPSGLANPAAGANFSLTVNDGQIWLLRSLTFQLVTSAAVASRNVVITVTDAAALMWRFRFTTAQVASWTGTYVLCLADSADNNYTAELAASTALYRQCFPALMLGPGAIIATAIENIQAADQLQNIKYSPQRWRS